MGKIITIDVAYGKEKVHLYERYKVATLKVKEGTIEEINKNFETEIIVLGCALNLPNVLLVINIEGKTQFLNEVYVHYIQKT